MTVQDGRFRDLEFWEFVSNAAVKLPDSSQCIFSYHGARSAWSCTELKKYTLTSHRPRAGRLAGRTIYKFIMTGHRLIYVIAVKQMLTVVFHLMEAMILMYWRALCAASLWALLQEMPVPWHTVTGEVDSSARHWYWPFTVSSSAKYSIHHVYIQLLSLCVGLLKTELRAWCSFWPEFFHC